MEPNTRLVGQSTVLLDAIERASRAAALDRPVLVIGERGTGKEMVAERLHRLSPRWDQPFVSVNCAALPENLLDAELFGYEAGAFTGASKARAGRFEEADGGTLFLDELGTLTAPAQERLLRVVEYGQFSRLGSNDVRTVDVRIVGATNADLPGLADSGRFRADLLDRLSFEVVTLPPLRVRGDDIMTLADHFGRRMAVEMGWDIFPGFSAEAERQLVDYDWPGNVRELKNVVERAVYSWDAPDEAIERLRFDPFESPWRPAEEMGEPKTGARAEPDGVRADDEVEAEAPVAQAVPQPAPHPGPHPHPDECDDLRSAVADYEKLLLAAALERCRYNQRETAAALALTYDQLRHALKKHDLHKNS
ncbi:phage shock protein operon transcriptional activator [Pacificimonas flava]|uniref:Phage shock protein operon transcriptional activator n=2 Tax=Pacificimonas TaxID=1960290 RepID=A0A219B2J8_9SPHN|nr:MULTISPECIES: phage shock protein operon transcriptional activator [Pacificimonas]MBZ6380073.1 phage shock protein operon transcriptional activator [Pacificimonas aurantium]OWV32038.1 phage shock protein operon transcriptional activator [Pacificimonas flava]